MKWTALACLVVLLSAIWGARLGLRHKEAPGSHRWLQVLLPVATMLLALFVTLILLRSTFGTWNGLRLAIVKAWLTGAPLYQPKDSGAIIGMVYGPVPALLWSPALLFQSLHLQFIVGTLLTCAVSLGAFGALIWCGASVAEPAPRRRVRCLQFSLFVGSLLVLFSQTSTRYMTTQIHFDSVALGMSLFSCVVLMYGLPKTGEVAAWKPLILAGLFALFGVWSKQNAAFTILAQMTFLGLAHGWPTLKRYTMVLALGGLSIFALCSLIFTGGGETILFNMVGVPSKHPPRAFGMPFLQSLFPHARLYLCVLAVAVWYQSSRPSTRPWWDRSTWAHENRWLLLLMTSLFLLPISVMGFNKVGGDVNSFHTLYFVIAACVALISEVEQAPKDDAHGPYASHRMVFLLALILIFSPLQKLTRFDVYVSRHRNSRHVQVYQYLKKHPGDVYFPWYPLPTINAEGKVYHFPYGVYDRFLSGWPLKKAHVRRHVPKKARYIAFHPKTGKAIFYGDFLDRRYPKFFLQLLSEYRYPTKLKELPGWYVFGKTPPK